MDFYHDFVLSNIRRTVSIGDVSFTHTNHMLLKTNIEIHVERGKVLFSQPSVSEIYFKLASILQKTRSSNVRGSAVYPMCLKL